MQKCMCFIDMSDALTGPLWTTRGKVKNPKTSATLHGNASRKCKMSATLHGNALFVRMVQMGLPKRVPKKRPKPSILRCFRSCLEPHRSTRVAHTKKWSSPKWRQRAPIASAQSIHFSDEFSRFWSFASASGAPFFFDSLSTYAKMHWFYTYLGRPH